MLDSRAFTELKLKLYDAAIADYDDVLKLAPNKEESLYGRGLAKRATGDKPGGDADIEAALKIRSDVPKDTILDVLRKGYFLNDKLLRPALVKVAVPKEEIED